MRDLHVPAVKAFPELQPRDCEATFRNIYAIFWKRMFAIAYTRLNNKQEAEDVVHDVFMSVWANMQRIEIRSLECYLSAAVKNLAFVKIRKRTYERRYVRSFSDPLLSESLIESSIHNKRMLERLQTEIEGLPEKCKLIFKCSRNSGMPVKQIAKQLSISPKTVENQLNKALKHLRSATKSF